MRMRLLSLTFLFVGTLACADVLELATGERVEGKAAQANAEKVTIEVGGQTLNFERGKVRAIYFGNATTPAATPAVSAIREALKALKALESNTHAGVTYQDYVRRVADTQALVDRHQSDTTPATQAMDDAMRYYRTASKTWEWKLTNPKDIEDQWAAVTVAVFSGDLASRCSHLRDLQERTRGAERSDVKWDRVLQAIPTLWLCASERIAEAARLLE